MKLQKETAVANHGKWYQDACGTAFAMELVGERWSMLIIRELMLGGRRFSDLRASLPGISAKVLTERLSGLEQGGVLVRRKLPAPASVQVYELTELGYHAEPAIQELGRWAARSPDHDVTLPLSPVSFMLSLRTMIDRARAPSVTGTFGFETGADAFLARLANGEMPVERAATDGADVVFLAPTPIEFAALFYGKVPLADWEAAPGRRCAGDRRLARRFIDLFALPAKAAHPGRA